MSTLREPRVAHESPFLCVAFYNVGINNSEVPARRWADKCEMLKRDIQKLFRRDRGVQAVFISEFGNMFIRIDGTLRSADLQRSKRLRGGVVQPAARPETSTQDLFESIVSEINRPDIKVRAHPPYVALVSSEE